MAQLAVVGNLALDRVDRGPPQPGGCPFFAAYALHAMRRPGQILTRCSDGDRELFEGALRVLGAPVTVLSGTHTAGFDHAYAGDIRRTAVTEIGDPWTASDAAHLDPDVAIVHVAPLLRSDFPPETVAALASGGRRVSFDGHGLVRVPELGPLEQDGSFDPRVLAHVSMLKLSEEEARIVGRGRFDQTTVQALGVAEIVVTFGSRGADVWFDGDVTHVPTTPVADVEATGAGDAFMVAYVSARHDGAAPGEAVAAGSSVVGRMLAERRRLS
jgi:sugar/nucleoside kinase (ribokinase family)